MERFPASIQSPVPRSAVFVFMVLMVRAAQGWHGLGNNPFHCWPLSASAASPTPYTSCPGVDIDWVVPPPTEIKAEAGFNVTYDLVISPEFYNWSVAEGIFNSAGSSPGQITNASQAQEWCENTVCPSDPSQADENNCCVYHVNVHSCPLSQTSVVTNGLCGPWIPPQGSIFTHSAVMVGPVGKGNWTSAVDGLYEVGLTSVIAHFKLAGMHIAIEQKVTVLPKTVCGDGVCEREAGESCDSCPKDCGTCPLKDYEVALIGVSLFLLLVGFISVFGYFRYQRRKLLWDESWIVSGDAIVEASADGGQMGSSLTMNIGSMVDIKSNQSMVTTAMTRQVFATVAYVDGRQVAVRKIRNKEFQLTKQIRMEVRDVRSLEHPNLCRFLGGCIETSNPCILYEYCPKGSLTDVLQNDAIPLNWSFRFSLLTDVARGMAFLHKHKMVHGNLKSNNCVVDDRWTCKVTDFGLKEYKRENRDSDPEMTESQHRKELQDRVYKAPETRSKARLLLPASDVYSFAIILVEVVTRDDAYGTEDASTVPEGWKPPIPQYDPDGLKQDPEFVCPSPQQYTYLIMSCWADKVEERPTFEHVKKTLHHINPNKLSPVDNMMAIMEKYSKHLESMVSERTQQLLEEKQRTDTLLYSMMPRQIADLLKAGHLVQAEQFEICTIYFSDIVGFTDLSGRSTALQVVDLLNKLYTTFDSIIEKYDVYKVETIGDAYMVVSGVPNRTEHHARHVAMMSLDMISASREFEIPHMPQEPLRIRVGLHSGSVCAGVVGIKMPRYCLFGDTVNTASRMESNGEAYKIHISDATFLQLQQQGSFVCEARGSIPVKGKGEMFTWWLIRAEDTPGKKTTPASEFGDSHLTEKEKKAANMDTVIQELLKQSDENSMNKEMESLLQ